MGLFGACDYMKTYHRKTAFSISVLVIGFLIGGCGEPVEKTEPPKMDLGTTIGSLTDAFAPESILVEGYGLAGGLRGTGSAECPPDIRAYLKQYILKQLAERTVDIEKLISSLDTAVVAVRGIMPAAVTKNQYFDLKVEALRGTQTTSLEGGWLYRAELKTAGSFGIDLRTLATAEGAVFIDTIEAGGTDKKAGYILAGGMVLDEYKAHLALRRPNYRIANAIRNRLNNRFPPDTARAFSPSLIELKVPGKYGEQKQRFISIVNAMYLSETAEVTEKRIDRFVRELADSEDKDASEAALEAIGNKCLRKLSNLVNSSNEEVRLRAARCMLNLGSDVGLEALREIAMDKDSAYRMEALETITAGASRNDAASLSRRLLREASFDIRLAAYAQLRKLEDITITQELIGGNFYLEQIVRTREKAIFVSRSGQPRIVLFGAPLYCRDNIFVESSDGNIIIDSSSGQEDVWVIRKVPKRPDIPPIKLKSSLKLSDIIRTLCKEAVVEEGTHSRPGLNVTYAEGIALLKQMCEKGAVEAQFRAGPLPKID